MAYCKKIVFLFFIFILLFTSVCFCADYTVNPSQPIDDNVVQWDNGILTMRQNQIDIQDSCIATLYQMYRTNPDGVKNFMSRIWEEWAQTSNRRLLVRAINNQWTKYGIYVYDPNNMVDDGLVNASFFR